ncbi:hemagglutinin repeat-containing protein [Proteus mirabilis]|uniref:hemagglutinin repeat-containing protein n=1 Tax=Proteus mirabilis TaxID=584 RepID=UPI003ED93264
MTATGKNKDSNPDSGNITVVGSELKAGKDLSLSATQDINLVSAQNTEQTTSQNSSKGSSVGVGVGVGAGGYGVNVSASVNQGKGHEKGNGLTLTETTLDAGNKLTLNSGQDATLKGAQVSGEQVTVNVGRDLILQSQIGGNRYSTRVYESQNLTDQQIYNYAEQLAAQPLTKVKDGIYTAKLADGTMITLRSVSSSAEQTGARWTIQIRNSPTLKQVENGLGKNAEIKFR